jgi:hypothetical protein
MLLFLLLMLIGVSPMKSVACTRGGIIDEEGWAINTNVHEFFELSLE